MIHHFISGAAIARVREATDLAGLAGEYVHLRRSGTALTGLCPFHEERTPSFTVNADKQLWYCHGCHMGGDAIGFLQRIEGLPWRSAMERLAERAGVTLDDGPRVDAQTARRARAYAEAIAREAAWWWGWHLPTCSEFERDMIDPARPLDLVRIYERYERTPETTRAYRVESAIMGLLRERFIDDPGKVLALLSLGAED